MSFGITSSFSRNFSPGNRPLTISSAAQLPSLEVWYDAASGTNFNKTTSITNNTAVTSWQNGGGLVSHDWNSTGGNRPVWFSNVQNSKGVVRFNPAGNTTQFLSINPIAYLQSLSACTLVILFKSTSSASGRRILTSSNSGGFQWGQNGSQWIGTMSGASFTVNDHATDTSFHHIVITFDGTQIGDANRVKARLDGSDVTLTFSTSVNATTSASASTFYGGVDSTGNSNFFVGDLGELMIFTRALKPTETLAVEEYLTNKWGV